MQRDTIFYYSEQFQHYDMGPQHPLQPIRLRRTYELLNLYGAFESIRLQEPTPCSVKDLLAIHSPDFVEAVHALSEGDLSVNPSRFGFGYGDNPIFHGMWEASLLYTGASADAAQAIVDGKCQVAMNLSGGLHHAHYARAAGFCILNDCAVAIHRLRSRFPRVAYIDIDVHHGDGVQELFYEDPSVLTISIHESGRTLFPGTGFVNEIGAGDGIGYCVNLPMWPGASDEVWLRTWRNGGLAILGAFNPNAIVLQMGTDAHYLDPLAHICLTAQGWLEAVRDIISLGKPIVALGGGGYNPTTVPRMWTLAAAALSGLELPDETPIGFSFHEHIPNLLDRTGPGLDEDDIGKADWYAGQTVEEVKRLLFPYHHL
jgi:acetoin utilization protein AcuC